MTHSQTSGFTTLAGLALLCLALTGCTYVRVSDAGAGVLQATSADVVNCRALGEVISQTRAKVLINRNAGKVAQELIDLARNQAVLMGANAIVPLGQPDNGMQKFLIYQCSQSGAAQP